jgi:hypothetical protein
VFADSVSGKISTIRIEAQEGTFNRVGYVVIRIAGAKTQLGCGFLYLSPEDKSAISLVQNAFVHDLDVKVIYDKENAPWGMGACPITTVWVTK